MATDRDDEARSMHLSVMEWKKIKKVEFKYDVRSRERLLVLISSDSAQRSSRALIQRPNRGRPTKLRLVGPHRVALYRLRWGPGRRT